MQLLRTIIYIVAVFSVVGVAESLAGPPPPTCELSIEINALRAGSPTVTVPSTKDVTAKARILKGTAPSGTTIQAELQIQAVDGSDVIFSQTIFPVELEVGKGGTGRKIPVSVTQCKSGSIDFVAKFSGYDPNNALCEATRSINRTCK